MRQSISRPFKPCCVKEHRLCRKISSSVETLRNTRREIPSLKQWNKHRGTNSRVRLALPTLVKNLFTKYLLVWYLYGKAFTETTAAIMKTASAANFPILVRKLFRLCRPVYDLNWIIFPVAPRFLLAFSDSCIRTPLFSWRSEFVTDRPRGLSVMKSAH